MVVMLRCAVVSGRVAWDEWESESGIVMLVVWMRELLVWVVMGLHPLNSV